jgi:hydrogenase/urease accessory protein HupE
VGALVRALTGRRAVSAVAVLAVGLPAIAASHTGGTTGFVSITVKENSARYTVSLYPRSLPAPVADTLLGAQAGRADARDQIVELVRQKISIAADGQSCVAGQGQVLPPDVDTDKVTVVVDFACARPIRDLRVRDDTFDVFGADHHTLAKVDAGGEIHQFALEPAHRDARVTVAASGASGEGGTSFFLLGVHHILSGWDHLLFLLALLLRGGTVLTILKIVTAFTVAHSATLALAVLDVVTLPSRLVESVIALSIAFAAAENFVPRRAFSARWAVAFAFGLVHGFGFAEALRELSLPRAGLAATLVGFNLGVEAGQALVVALAWPLLIYLGRASCGPLLTRACAVMILVIGLALFVERAFVP